MAKKEDLISIKAEATTCGCCSNPDQAAENDTAAPAVDPVCGMTVDPATAASSVHQGQTYYFCAPGCRRAFERQPRQPI